MTYSDYSNYETWAVSLWLHNTESMYQALTGLVDDVKATTDDPKERLDAVSEVLQSYVESKTPEVEGLWRDLMTHSLEEVDWHEMADTWLED